MLEQHIKTLCEDLEIETFPQKEKGDVYAFPLNPQTTVFIHELDPGLSFRATLGPCPIKKREELFIKLMKANFLGQGTGGATIALDENENFLTLSSVLPYDMNYKMFKDAFEDFTNYLDFWKEELARHQKLAEESIM